MPQSHDQNFKNLILDYPREALQLFAATEADQVDASVRILPLREQQLKERLGDRFRELDVPLLLEWPDGRRAALLFVVEEHTETGRFSIHRLAHYCLDLADLLATDRVVPVVIFLHPGPFVTELVLGGDRHRFLEFRYLAYALFQAPAREHFDSPNLIARLNLPNMAYAPEEKMDVYAQAVRGLLQLEPDPERQIKYLDFIDIYADLDENERALYQQRYAQEAAIMSGFAERFIQKGHAEGRAEGRQEEGVSILMSLLTLKFGPLTDETRQRVQQADPDTLVRWAQRALTAADIVDVFDGAEDKGT